MSGTGLVVSCDANSTLELAALAGPIFNGVFSIGLLYANVNIGASAFSSVECFGMRNFSLVEVCSAWIFFFQTEGHAVWTRWRCTKLTRQRHINEMEFMAVDQSAAPHRRDGMYGCR